MLYYFFRFLEKWDIPGSGMWSYISFRALLAVELYLLPCFVSIDPLTYYLHLVW